MCFLPTSEPREATQTSAHCAARELSPVTPPRLDLHRPRQGGTPGATTSSQVEVGVGVAVGSAGCLLLRLEAWKEASGCRGPSFCLPLIPPRQLRGLYKGMSSPMAGVAFVNAIVFGVHGNMVKHIENPDSLRYAPPPRRSASYLQSASQ